MDCFTPALRLREDDGDEDGDEEYIPGPDVKKRLFDGESETPLRTVIKQPVLVYLRVRPKNNQELKEQDFFQVIEENAVLTTSVKDESQERFFFSNVFLPSATQKDVFNKSVMPILKDFFDGQNCLLFTYGITNSGKTHTIMGTTTDPGVLPRALDVIFNSIDKGKMNVVAMKPKYFSEVRTLSASEHAKEQETKDKLIAQAKQVKVEGNSSSIMEDDTSNTSKASFISNCSDVTGDLFGLEGYQTHETISMEIPNAEDSYFSIWISFVEIYNEIISDLLAGGATVKLKEDKHKNFFLDGAKEIRVDSVEEALLLLKLGLKHRHVAGTKLNYQSSRSHSIYTIKCIKTVNDRPSHALVNRISIIDLAGTERSAKTGAKGQRVKEAGKINQSLMTLGRCITAMRHNQNRGVSAKEQLIPYRDSKLTQLFQNYLVGKGKGIKQGKISMIINVSNNASVYDETMNVLKFSALTSEVVPIARTVCVEKLSVIETEAEVTLVPRPSQLTTGASRSSTEDMFDGRQMEAASAVEEGPAKCTCGNDLDGYKSLIKQLQVELIEQEAKIREEVCQEFHQQLTEIEENHSREMEEQQQELTSLYQGRIKQLNETTKKMKGQKRRRPNDDKSEDREDNANIEENVLALKKEMELERQKAVSELKDLTETYEANIVRLNEQLNSMSLKLLSSERNCENMKQRCEVLQLENVGCKQQCDELRQECVSLKQLSEYHSEVTMDEFKTQSDLLRQEMQLSKKLCEELKEEIRSKEEQMYQKLATHQSELKAAAERHATEMAGQKEEFQAEMEILQCRISELTQEVEELQGGKMEKSKSLLSDAGGMFKINEGLQTMASKKDELCAEIEGLETDRETKFKLLQKIKALSSEKDELCAEIEGLETERETKSKLLQEIKALSSEKDELCAEIEGLEIERETKSKLLQEIKALSSEKDELCTEIEGLVSNRESRIAELKEQLLASERSLLQDELLQERMERLKMQTEKDARIREVAELRALVEHKTEEISSLRTQLDDLESKNAELSGGLKESFSSTFEEMNGTLQRQRDRIAELTCDIEKYKRENEELTENSIELQMQIQRTTTSRDTYANQLEELTKEYEDLKRSSSQRESKLLDAIDQTNSAMDEQVADLKNRCATLEHELAGAKETACELQLCVRKKDGELLEAQKQLSRLQIELVEASQTRSLRVEELTSCRAALEAEREKLKEEREKHQAELESIQGNHQLETAHLLIRIRDLEGLEAKKAEALSNLEASEAKKTKALASDKKTKALLASAHEEIEDLKEQMKAWKQSVELGESELAKMKNQRDGLLSEVAQMKEEMVNQIAALQQKDIALDKQKVEHDLELQKMNQELKLEAKEKEWLKAELQKKEAQAATKDTAMRLQTVKTEDSCSPDSLDTSKPNLPLVENSQLLESFVDPVKEDRVHMTFDLTPVPARKGGRKRKALEKAKPADSVPQESPVKKARTSRRNLPTTALEQQNENENVEAEEKQVMTKKSFKEQLTELLPSKSTRSTRRTKLLKSQISGPLEVIQDVAATPTANKGKFVLGMELRAPRTLRSALN